MPYLVRFGGGIHGDPDGEWWCDEVERVTSDGTDVTPADIDDQTVPPSRLSLLDAARRLVGEGASADDLLKIAIYLEGN